jgi:aspartate dehydrogenase
MKVALIGCGAMGKVVAKAILANEIPGAQLVAVAEVRPTEEIREISKKAGFALVRKPEEVLKYSPDLVIEAAEQEVVREYAPLFVKAKKDIMIMSVGSLGDIHFLNELLALARSQGVRIIVPSGAIGGLDVIKSANVGKLTEVTIRNIKPPQALEGAPFVVRNKIDLRSISTPTVIYEGFAEEAAREFPKNVNVAVALSLAGVGPAKTRVIVIVDPGETRNVHEITAKGDFGEASLRVASLPSPDNPKTSHLAALSAIATLRKLTNPLQVGT